MKQLHKESYEAPLAEVLEVRMEENLLQGSVGIQSSREGGYGDAVEDEWE